MQIICVIIAVAAAAAYLGWKAWKAFFSKKSSCDGCAFSQAGRHESPGTLL